MSTLLVFLLSSLAIALSLPAMACGTVNLDEPGAMAQLERDNPAHARSIGRILQAAPKFTLGHLAQWMRTSFNADIQSTQLLKTSDPPQARLWFKLGDTHYKATVTLNAVGALRVPAG
ncbi:hypothetical protein INH39_28500 [Massilia violaceinigra]|uniref:Lipoprotein n=1 Tax=Massilia violaceinigra TaxID=2045208 RepID=A0ABY4A3S6_9BURK|nr:hypothetical protein [Massilia violaceinigra]UOD29308.1 hypothetical protein INH39_28500 [Massilia violaceinigra]